MPFRITAGKAYGPGIFDMKAGIVQALFAHHALQKLNLPLNKRIVFLWTSDEEIGSDSSRKAYRRPKPAAAMPFSCWSPPSARAAC